MSLRYYPIREHCITRGITNEHFCDPMDVPLDMVDGSAYAVGHAWLLAIG